jgi:hypothetical protein
VQRNAFEGTGMMGHVINRRLGDPAYAATGVVDGWLKQVFGAWAYPAASRLIASIA